MDDYRKYFKGKHVLITGGAGATGSSFVKALIPLEPARIKVLDALSSAMV